MNDAKPPPAKKTGNRAGQPKAKLPDRICESCGVPFGRRRHKSGRLEGPQEFALRRFCPEHTSRKNAGGSRPAKPPTPVAPFNPATRLPDPTSHKTLSHSAKDESNTKGLPNLLVDERASGVKHEPVPIEQFECAARRAKKLHPEFAAMLKGDEVRGPVVGEVVT